MSSFEPILGTLIFLLDALASLCGSLGSFLQTHIAGNVTLIGTLLRPNACLLVIVAVSTPSRPKNLGT